MRALSQDLDMPVGRSYPAGLKRLENMKISVGDPEIVVRSDVYLVVCRQCCVTSGM